MSNDGVKKSKLNIQGMLCNGMRTPLGVSVKGCILRWIIAGEGKNIKQIQRWVQISEQENFEHLTYEGKSYSGETQWELKNVFQEKTKYYWRVRVQISHGEKAEWLDWSDYSFFETAMAGQESWEAQWIEANEEFYKDALEVSRGFWKKNIKKPEMDQGLRRPVYFHREWNLSEGWECGRVYITALGFYQLTVNDTKIGDYALAPDFTAYDKLVYYQTYDITPYLKNGKNSFDIILADGWYAGHAQGIPGMNYLYGERPALIMQAEVGYADGKMQKLCSDDTFEAYSGPFLYADLFMGEYLDMRQSLVPYGTVKKAYPKHILTPQEYEGIKVKTVLEARTVTKFSEGSFIADFGQVLAGREKITLENEAGQLIKIEHSEILNPDSGDLLEITQRFPFHDQTDYIYVTTAHYVYEPQFSFQGYRYIKISGLKGELNPGQCKSVVLETGLKDTSCFECSDGNINRLIQNAYWSQCGNMISIPTDCPQRERGGFTGDAQIFCSTAIWQQEVQGFFRRWLKQCRLEQLKRGQIPIVVPYTDAYRRSEPNPGWTSAGWGDAIIFVARNLYEGYGNINILEENYEAMEKWMAYVTACAEDSMPEQYYMDYKKRPFMKYLWNTGYHWGDWLMPGFSDEDGVAASKEITAALFYFREAKCMYQISEILGKEDRAAYYKDLTEKIRLAFHSVYITKDKRLLNELQGLYVMAIAFGMVQDDTKRIFERRLEALVKAADYHLATGFLSTPFLLDVLWDAGFHDTACKVLYQDTCPSWLYGVKMGATTIWENWEGIREDGSISTHSFNHYAFGCIADFIYRRIAGVKRLAPGFRKIMIYPEVTDRISCVSFSYDTLFGEIKVRWEKAEEGYQYWLSIPHGMEAVVKGNKEIKEIGSGEWVFTLK